MYNAIESSVYSLKRLLFSGVLFFNQHFVLVFEVIVFNVDKRCQTSGVFQYRTISMEIYCCYYRKPIIFLTSITFLFVVETLPFQAEGLFGLPTVFCVPGFVEIQLVVLLLLLCVPRRKQDICKPDIIVYS